MKTVRKQENGYPRYPSVSVRIRSVSILREGNWKETKIQLSKISEFVSVQIRSVSILINRVFMEFNSTKCSLNGLLQDLVMLNIELRLDFSDAIPLFRMQL